MYTDLKLNISEAASSFARANLLTIVLSFRCREVKRSIKFDCGKSILAFSMRLGKVVDQLPT